MISDNQKKAIEYGEGPLMIVAGPGSGKTFVIVERIKYLIQVRGVDPDSILVVTFSKKAANEMRQRCSAAVDRKVTIGTFHSVFYHILLEAYGERINEYFSEEETPEDDLKRNGTPMFDDMLSLTEELLRERKDICELVKRRFRWILIDEFQDIDTVQYAIIRSISDRNSNITIVGDDDQSIYRFRGARPDIMLNFRNDYPGAYMVYLDMNYRSTPQIVAAASRLIKQNTNRFEKSICSFRGPGDKVRVIETNNSREEYDFVCREIISGIASGRVHSDYAVLYRNNTTPWGLMHVMNEYGIPFSVKASSGEHEVKSDAVALMTYHASKGLEFRFVYLIDCNAEVVPSPKARTQEDEEEERRMFYVAMTRARDGLCMLLCRKRFALYMEPSSFIPEILML